MARKTKKQIRLEEALIQKDLEGKRIKEILISSSSYTAALHPLIELYLDAYEVYHIKYSEWKDIGFKTTKIHTNKNGAKNEIKHPLAQQVEVWSDKKAKLLNQLGLDVKNKNLVFTGPLINEQNSDNEQKKGSKSKLVQLNQMRK